MNKQAARNKPTSIWVFPKIGVPPNLPSYNRVFHYTPFLGTTIFGNIHIYHGDSLRTHARRSGSGSWFSWRRKIHDEAKTCIAVRSFWGCKKKCSELPLLPCKKVMFFVCAIVPKSSFCQPFRNRAVDLSAISWHVVFVIQPLKLA